MEPLATEGGCESTTTNTHDQPPPPSNHPPLPSSMSSGSNEYPSNHQYLHQFNSQGPARSYVAPLPELSAHRPNVSWKGLLPAQPLQHPYPSAHPVHLPHGANVNTSSVQRLDRPLDVPSRPLTGWYEATTDTGIPYFYHSTLRVPQWTRPTGDVMKLSSIHNKTH